MVCQQTSPSPKYVLLYLKQTIYSKFTGIVYVMVCQQTSPSVKFVFVIPHTD